MVVATVNVKEKKYEQILFELKKLNVSEQKLLELKNYYKHYIDTPRTFSRINTIQQFIKFLCKRLIISVDNTNELYEILKILGMKNNNIGLLLNELAKLQGKVSLRNNNKNILNSTLRQETLPPNAIDVLCKLDKSWKKFIRDLPVTFPENEIDRIDNLNVTEKEKCRKVIEYFMKLPFNNKIEILLDTLEKWKRDYIKEQIEHILYYNIHNAEMVV